MLTVILIGAAVCALLLVLLVFISSTGDSVLSVSEEMATHNTKAREYGRVLGGGCGCASGGTKKPK